jgi:molecular chaperone DnaK
MAVDNRSIGRFDLVGIPPAPRGVPQIEVIFDIDANGILHVSAKDLGTGKEQKIRIEVSSGLSEDEIEKMVKQAEEFASEDEQKASLADARNQADSLVYSVEKSLTDYGDKVDESEKQAIKEGV